MKRSVVVVEKRRKKIIRENLKPRIKLIKQQNPWRTSQKSEDGDESTTESSEFEGVLKLLLLLFCCNSFMALVVEVEDGDFRGGDYNLECTIDGVKKWKMEVGGGGWMWWKG